MKKANQVKKSGPIRYYTKEITEIVRNFNLVDIGPLIDISLDDTEKPVHEIDDMRLAETRALHLTSSRRFLKYSQVRAVSFAHKIPMELLQNWVMNQFQCESKISRDFMEIFSFLIFEVVGELIHLAFCIQEERNYCGYKGTGDPRGVNPDTCMSAPYFQVSLIIMLSLRKSSVVSINVSENSG